MEIIGINATRGPNYWSIRRPQLIVMQLDIGELEERPTDEIEGFYHRIKKALPGLYEHYCSEGRPGGFLERVKRGTWMGHVIEHIALELQTMAGLDVNFGRARGTGNRGQYFVVFEYADEASGRLAARKAVSIAQDLVEGPVNHIEDHVQEIREANLGSHPGPSTASLLSEAVSRNIPAIKLEESSTYQLGYGRNQKKIAATIASSTGHMAVELASDKAFCKKLFKKMAIPVAEGDVVSSPEELSKAAEEIKFPLVIKPLDGNQGRGVTTNIRTNKGAEKAFRNAAEISDSVIVERHVHGNDYRLLAVNYTLVAASQRVAAHVIGDGKSTIKELIRFENSDKRRGDGHNKALTKITFDGSSKEILKRKDYSLRTVLEKNEMLYLAHAANLSKGGTASDVTDEVHPNIKDLVERISKIIGLDICGIDLIAKSLKKPLNEANGAVLEVNAAPGFRMHLTPSSGKPRNVAAPVLDMLFPNGEESRIPVIAVTGTNGKTTTTRLIVHIMKTDGRKTGSTTTDGIYINDRLLRKGDCGGPKSARDVLKDPTVDTAVLECARGGILRSGLGFDQCDVGVVTNVASDHLGISGINTLEKMSRVKSVIPESVKGEGYAVLNADDDCVYSMKGRVKCKVILFSRDSDNKRIVDHQKAGGISVVYQDEQIKVQDGDETHFIENIEHVPLSFNGRAPFMIENILAAVGAAYCQNIKPVIIRQALHSFKASAKHTPGRMNLFDFGHFDVLVDYAHNPAGLKAIEQFLNHSSYTRKVGIVAGVGDRRDEDSHEIGLLAARIFDKVIIREDVDLRGKEPGETTELVKEGIADSAFSPQTVSIFDEKQALLFALNTAQPGSLVFLCTEQVHEALKMVQQQQATFKKRKYLTA